MKKLVRVMAVAGAMTSLLAGAANAAQTASSTFQAQITIQAQCVVNSPNTLDFGPQGLLNTNVTAQMDFTVECTNGTSYTIALDNGANASGSTNRMSNGSGEYVSYETYSDSGHTSVWDTSSTVSGTGNGDPITHTVYGLVPPQTTPAPGTYTDTVTITVSY